MAADCSTTFHCTFQEHAPTGNIEETADRKYYEVLPGKEIEYIVVSRNVAVAKALLDQFDVLQANNWCVVTHLERHL